MKPNNNNKIIFRKPAFQWEVIFNVYLLEPEFYLRVQPRFRACMHWLDPSLQNMKTDW